MNYEFIKKGIKRSYTCINNYIKRKVITLYPTKKPLGIVLLSYITTPFQFHIDKSYFFSHTNNWECAKIAQTWVNNGYQVDIIDWDNNHFIPKKDYAVFIDIHNNMERLAPVLRPDCLKILHITGAHWLFQNTAEYKRLLALQNRNKVTLIPRRTAQPSRGIENADCATILGNKFTQKTFSYANKPLHYIPLSTNAQFPFFENKEFYKVRKNYLWFGGSGMVHKGLDLVLEVFRELPDYNLTICGPVNAESDFEEAYYKELYETSNIKTVGWIDVNSKQFSDILKTNIGLVYPSCSEGGGGSVITCLHAGLIPIISYESSVDIPNFGKILQDPTLQLKQAIEEISGLSETDLKSRSKMAWDYARGNYTQECFAKEYDKFVKLMISTMRT
jgi:glycosyltransferase involved in cell wall biosynthesis